MTTLAERKEMIDQKFHGGNRNLRTLQFHLDSSEEDTIIDDVFVSIQDNLNNPNALDKCNLVISRFTYKAIQTNYSAKWLQIIEELITAYDNLRRELPCQLYISKSSCLGQFQTFDNEIEICLKTATLVSRNDLEKIEALIKLAYYYDGIGSYSQMEQSLIQAESICKISLSEHIYIADIWCALGCLKFITFDLNVAMKYFQKSLGVLKNLDRINDNSISKIKFAKTYSTCLHYMGRIKLEKHQFKECIDFYIQSECKLVDFCRDYKITQDVGATAFYHLRVAQVLDLLGLTKYADYHYQQSKHFFETENPYPSGLSQMTLAISKQEEQIKKSIEENSRISYGRGYLMSSIKLFVIYCKSLKLHLAFALIVNIFFKLLTDKLISFRYVLILLKQIFLSSYGLSIYTKLKIVQLKLLKSNEILTVCPCPDPKCKEHTPVKSIL